MRLLIKVIAGATASVATYYIARPMFRETEQSPAIARNKLAASEGRTSDGNLEAAGSRAPARPTGPPPVTSLSVTDDDQGVDAGPSAEQRSAMTMLRNEVIRATSEDMQRRGDSILTCLDGVRLSGAEKLRFLVEVVSSPDAATIGRWRFMEIAEGEPLPASFASCASHAFGSGQHLTPPQGFHFPDYGGDLMILYTIPAPATDSLD